MLHAIHVLVITSSGEKEGGMGGRWLQRQSEKGTEKFVHFFFLLPVLFFLFPFRLFLLLFLFLISRRVGGFRVKKEIF